MTAPQGKDRENPTPEGDTTPGTRLSKEERKVLLTQLESQAVRSDTPEQILQRAERALAAQEIEKAVRLQKHLQSRNPQPAGMEQFLAKLAAAQKQTKYKENVNKAEEMLRRYIQQRKKPLAQLALETLKELAPNHPRVGDYEQWIADLDQEMALQKRADTMLQEGRQALQENNINKARKTLETLQRLDPTLPAAETFELEIARTLKNQANNADIDRVRHNVEELLIQGKFDAAEQELNKLSRMDIPKLTIDFLRQQLAENRAIARDQADSKSLEATFTQHLAERDWQKAREVAHQFGERFPNLPRAAELFNQVNEIEAAERRQLSIREGIQTLERFVAEGKRAEAQLALKLLHNLNLDTQQLATLEQKVRNL